MVAISAYDNHAWISIKIGIRLLLGAIKSGKTNKPKNETGNPAAEEIIQPDIGKKIIKP